MPDSQVRRSLHFAAGFSALAAILILIGFAAYTWHGNQHWQRNLDLFISLLPMEAMRLKHWESERRADIAYYSSDLARRPAILADASKSAAWFQAAARAHPEYLRMSVYEPGGRLVWTSAPDSPPRFHPRPDADGSVELLPLRVEGGLALVTAVARAGPLTLVVEIDATVSPVPSLATPAPDSPGGFDLYLARRTETGVEVADHDPARPGAMRLYRLGADSAVGRALAGEAMAVGDDHFGRTVFAMPAPAAWLGWRALASRDIGRARSDSRLLALVFGSLGALAMGGTFWLVSRQLLSAEDEGSAAHRRLELLTRLTEALRVCSTACRLAGSRRELAQEICRALSEGGAFQFTTIWEPAPGERMRPLACVGLKPGTSLPETVPARPSGDEEQSAVARAFNSQETVIVSDLATDARIPKFREFGLAQGVRSVMAVPLAGVCAGEVLVATSPQPDFFKGEALSLVDAIAADFTVACAAFEAAERSVRIDAELAKNKRLLEHVATALPLGIYIFDLRRGGNVFATPAVEAIVGTSLERIQELGPALFMENLHPDDMGVFSGYAARFKEAADGEVIETTYRFRAGKGWKWLKSRDVVFERSEAGEPTLVLGTLEDVTASVEAQEALEQSWRDYRRVLQAVECAAESIVITDEKGIIQYVNPACSRITGFTREEAVGKHTRGLKSGVHPPEFYQSLWRTISSGRVWNGRLVNKAKDGSFFEEDASIAPVMDEDGRITNYVAVKKDVTKELSLESQLQQSQKLEAVGRLAGGIAHDFNNILTAILGYTQLSLQALPEGSPLREDLAEVEKGARRAADLTRQLLIFSRKQVIKPQVLDPSQVALGLQKMLRRIVGEDFHLRFVSDAAGARILADPGQLEQVVMNFVVNARDAMPKGGDIEVAVRETDLVEPAPGVEGPIPAGKYAVISVRDTGHGIPPDVLPRIFEPFYTTKPAGEGTGLGLSTVYGIVKQGGAYLRVESAPGAGTVMSVFWPTAAPAGASEASAAASATRGGAETLLLVEDEPSILLLAERLLKNAGYGVKAFPDASSALDWARTADARFELLFTDVILPGGKGGKALADELAALRPGLPVLFTSGYSADAVSNHGVLAEGTRLLAKPFSEDSLLRAVRAALDGTDA